MDDEIQRILEREEYDAERRKELKKLNVAIVGGPFNPAHEAAYAYLHEAAEKVKEATGETVLILDTEGAIRDAQFVYPYISEYKPNRAERRAAARRQRRQK
jgi:nicotinic acid mononucleotide adenylyltransferase